MEALPILKRYGAYFIRPFPSTQGFSAYRFPGILLHIPLFLIFLFIGLYLNLGTPWLRPFIVFYIVIGVYLGRDIAVYAHYMPLIIIAVIALFIFSPSLVTIVLKPLRTTLGERFPFFSLAIDLGAIAAFMYYVHHSWVKKEP
jgi:hypothetical protein